MFRFKDDPRHKFTSMGQVRMAIGWVVGLVVGLLVFSLLIWFLPWLPIVPMLFIALFFAILTAGIHGFTERIRTRRAQAGTARDRRANREAERQKQIDQMRRKNSRIPKIER